MTPDRICRERGYHDYQEFIDPKSGGFDRCKTCGHEVDREDPDRDIEAPYIAWKATLPEDEK
jgi:hypothetical protein